ncbi:MAG: thymidylate synthase [Candidatus Paceibacterota bacterium]|jgi:thymidylate synthase|nr:thymidylate synthase [bacterium]
MKETWPKYYQNQLIVNAGEVAVVCGWTKKEVIWNNLSEETRLRVAIMGQLYSKEGINYIIRNIFLNPKIKYLVITGSDLSGSIKELRQFLENGESKFIHPEIPAERIKEFYNYFSKNYSIVNLNEVDSFISNLKQDFSDWTKEIIDFPSHSIEITNMFLSEDIAFRVEGAKVHDVWLKVLDRIIKFGKDKMSSYGECQKELLDTITVINNDDPDNPVLPEYLYFNEQDLIKYYPQLMTDKIFDGVEYTYGSRLRNHEGIDQIQGIINELKRENYSRRAIAFTWDVEKDFNNEKCPCLDLVQALVQNGCVYLTAYFRSNDMYRAWPQNAYGLLKIQKEIAEALSLGIGKLAIISCSAHIYERDLREAQQLLATHKPKLECNVDFRGNFTVQIIDGEIVVRHLDLDGVFLQEIKGKTAFEIRDKIIPFISDVAHALYLGTELIRAEISLKENKEYIQDN